MTYLSEEDIRTKVVYEWLKDCGLSSDDILLESSFKLKLGKQTKIFRPRTDVLVKSNMGENLLVIEVKSPSHNLNNDDIDQAVSYARLLIDGIAPFTILTNGIESKIYDSVTKEEINSKSIPLTHAYVLNGFKPNSDGLNAKLEAAEYLITISSDNLKSFCQIQVEDKMSILKGDDIYSGKKYIPSLYVERKEAQEELSTKLFKEKNQLLLVIGNPQQGKTCFMCHNVEQFLSNDYLSLFYPGINLNKGLLSAIKEDFEWCFSNELSVSQLLKKVNSICVKQDKQLFIFIDGWDEMAEGALEINEECKRLNLSNISIVLSLTIPSLDRLLVDSVDNLTYVGEEVGLSQSAIKSLSKKLLKKTKDKQIIQVEKFNKKESLLAREVYEKEFEVLSMPDGTILHDPFYLRITCEIYAKKHIPTNLIRTDLIQSYLFKKAARRNIGEFELLKVLSQLAEIFYEYGRPADLLNCIHIFKEDENIVPWKESGILIQSRNLKNSLIDFYNTNILNYSISNCYKKWGVLFKSKGEKEILDDLEEACRTDVSRSALLWFLGCPENCNFIQKLFGIIDLKHKKHLPMLRVLVEAIMIQMNLNDVIFSWIGSHIKESKSIDEMVYKGEELPALIYTVLKSIDFENDSLEYKYWMRLLLKSDNSFKNIGIEESYISKFYGEIRSIDGHDDTSGLDTDLFLDLIFDHDVEVAKRAAIYYSYSSMYSYLENFQMIKKVLVSKNRNLSEILIEANNHVDNELAEIYYGSYCKGWLLQHEDFFEDEIFGVRDEFHRMNKLLPDVISTHPNTKLAKSLQGMLEDLKRIGKVDDVDVEIKYDNPNQLNLDL